MISYLELFNLLFAAVLGMWLTLWLQNWVGWRSDKKAEQLYKERRRLEELYEKTKEDESWWKS